jgi:predicted nucleic acid-binding protein
VKWFLAEDRSNAAQELRGAGVDLVAPSSVIFEIYHALWDAARTGRVPTTFPTEAAPLIPTPFARLVPMADLFHEAAALAHELGHPIYDCVYLSLARREDIEVITADRDMARAGRKAKIKIRAL